MSRRQVALTITPAARPGRDAIFVAQLQDFVSLLDLRGDDGRLAINSYTRTRYGDRVVGFDFSGYYFSGHYLAGPRCTGTVSLSVCSMR